MLRISRSLVLPLLLLGLLAGCASRAQFSIVRPAILDASQVGNTFSIQPFGGVDPGAAYRIQSEIAQRINTSLNPAIRLLSHGGGVIVTGEVLDYSAREEIGQISRTCSRSVQYRDSRGRIQTRTENYACIETIRTVNASAAVRFVVMVSTTGQVVFDRTYRDQNVAQTRATNGMPDGIDSQYLLDTMIAPWVDEFARVILPWPDTVTVAFSGCGGADGCGEAFSLIQQGDLAGAEARYTEILGPYAEPTPSVDPDDRDIVAETLFNRGVIRSYTGSYELGMQDLTRALEIRPNETRWRNELTNIESLANEQDALRQQMGQALEQGVSIQE